MLLHLKLHTGIVSAARIEVVCFIFASRRIVILRRFGSLAGLC